MQLIGVKIQQVDVPNKNNHVYTRETIEQVIADYDDSEKILFGTIGMSNDRAIVHSSHRIDKLRIEDGWLVGDVTVLETETGNALATMLEAHPLDFRMDGFCNIDLQDGKIVVTDYTLHRVNAVLDGA